MGKNHNTVKNTVDRNLCISCGICKTVCPVDCIQYDRLNGMFQPIIDSEKCIHCGRCFQVCPGNGFDHDVYMAEDREDRFSGGYKEIYSAKAKDKEICLEGTSGGVITQMIIWLLENDWYDCAFCLDSFDYSECIHTVKKTKEDTWKETAKSRYICVSHTAAADFILKNRDKRVILTGTGCAVHGILNLISQNKLDRDQYLLLGLFCDMTMTYNVFRYFEKYAKKSERLEQLIFRSKRAGGWPGNMILKMSGGREVVLDRRERIQVKKYFMPEVCTYCLDKLNQFADISVGDDYTENGDQAGASSIIIRTDRGCAAWKECCDMFLSKEETMEEIKKAQHLENRKKNAAFSRLKGLEGKLPCDFSEKEMRKLEKEYRTLLEMQFMGRNSSPQQIKRDIWKRLCFRKIKNLFSV